MTREDMIDKTAGLMTMNAGRDELMHSYYMKMYNYLSEKDTELLEGILEEVKQTYNNNLGNESEY